jgi:hypothetical protein
MDNRIPAENNSAHSASEMVRIFGTKAEDLARAQSRKFAARGDAEGVKTWDEIGTAIKQLRLRDIGC